MRVAIILIIRITADDLFHPVAHEHCRKGGKCNNEKIVIRIISIVIII